MMDGFSIASRRARVCVHAFKVRPNQSKTILKNSPCRVSRRPVYGFQSAKKKTKNKRPTGQVKFPVSVSEGGLVSWDPPPPPLGGGHTRQQITTVSQRSGLRVPRVITLREGC